MDKLFSLNSPILYSEHSVKFDLCVRPSTGYVVHNINLQSLRKCTDCCFRLTGDEYRFVLSFMKREPCARISAILTDSMSPGGYVGHLWAEGETFSFFCRYL